MSIDHGLEFPERFPLKGFLRSDTALRHNIDLRNPPADVVRALHWGAVNILQPIRDHYSRPVIVTSGWRPSELNRIIGGSDSSQHMDGCAADFTIPGLTPPEIVDWIMDQPWLQYDQVICEFTWVHVSWINPADASRISPRRQALRTYTDRRSGKTKYEIYKQGGTSRR